MRTDKRQRLEAAGWRVGDTADFLQLTPEESALVAMKLSLSRTLRKRRQGTMTQTELARRMGSSQSRIATAENGDGSVSLDLLVRALLAVGATPAEIGEALARSIGSPDRLSHPST